MRVFISWSGEQSYEVALLLKTWVKCVIQASEPWVSSEDIDRGSLWLSDISNTLSDCTIGIICLTKDNLNSPWILFESGALAKGLTSSRICTFLIDLQPQDVKQPLAQFNHTVLTKDGILKLFETINKLMEKPLEKEILTRTFNICWNDYEGQLNKIISDFEIKKSAFDYQRSDSDILDEMLHIVRGLDKRIINNYNGPYFKITKSDIVRNLKSSITKSMLDYKLSNERVSEQGVINYLAEEYEVSQEQAKQLKNISEEYLRLVFE